MKFFPDIVDAAMSSGMTKLVEAVKAAGLVVTLKSPGPFTVFAPTDEAFNKNTQSRLGYADEKHS